MLDKQDIKKLESAADQRRRSLLQVPIIERLLASIRWYAGDVEKVDRSDEPLVWPTETLTDKREQEQKIKLNHNFK